MSSEIENFRNQEFESSTDDRLLREWELLEERFEYGKDKRIYYTIRKRNASQLPTAYDIHFNIKTIVGVNPPNEQGLKTPVFGDNHIMRITIPNNYPTDKLDIKFSTEVWHPNIRFFGEFKGHVCWTPDERSAHTHLVDLVDVVTDYLTYDDYHAENIHPYPEDLTVAEWVIEQAKPNGWLKFTQN